MSSAFKVPSWAGKPPAGLHLDVMKNGSVLQKLLVDEKPCYLFGRNRDTCDFPLQHESCSRLHAALVYHKHLNRMFLIDNGSTHGTFIGSMRLEIDKPTQIPLDTTMQFGASSRLYTLRERPQAIGLVSEDGEEGEGGALLGILELDNEVDDLTQYNTAHNRQISTVGIRENEKPRKHKHRPSSVCFAEEEEIINPEDVDPSIGKFRNMIQSTVIPTKRKRLDSDLPTTPTSPSKPFKQPLSSPTALTADAPLYNPNSATSYGLSSSLFGRGISAAPPVDNPMDNVEAASLGGVWSNVHSMPSLFSSQEPKKKKYVKEAWPGKKPAGSAAVVSGGAVTNLLV